MKQLALVSGSVLMSVGGASLGFIGLFYNMNRDEVIPLDFSLASLAFYLSPWIIVIVGFFGLAMANRIKN